MGSEIDRKKIVFDQSIFVFSSINIGFDSILPGNFVSKDEADFKVCICLRGKYTVNIYGLFYFYCISRAAKMFILLDVNSEFERSCPTRSVE